MLPLNEWAGVVFASQRAPICPSPYWFHGRTPGPTNPVFVNFAHCVRIGPSAPKDPPSPSTTNPLNVLLPLFCWVKGVAVPKSLLFVRAPIKWMGRGGFRIPASHYLSIALLVPWADPRSHEPTICPFRHIGGGSAPRPLSTPPRHPRSHEPTICPNIHYFYGTCLKVARGVGRASPAHGCSPAPPLAVLWTLTQKCSDRP